MIRHLKTEVTFDGCDDKRTWTAGDTPFDEWLKDQGFLEGAEDRHFCSKCQEVFE